MFASTTANALFVTYFSDFTSAIVSPLGLILTALAGLTILGFIWRKSRKVTGKKF